VGAYTHNTFKAEQYDAALAQTACNYYKLLMVVGAPGSGKTAFLRSISEKCQIPLLNLGLELSKKLLSLTVTERRLKASDVIADLLDACGSARLAVDNTEIMFDPALMLNPLGLLQSISRTRLLVWSWNGEVQEGHVTYAYPRHAEYNRTPTAEMTLIAL
jgi:hypothetical protein